MDQTNDKHEAHKVQIDRSSFELTPQRANPPERMNKSFHHVRYLIISFGGLAIGVMFLTRLSVTIAILSMVNHTHLYLMENPNSTAEEYFGPDHIELGEFGWSNEIQQSIISGYMIAYTIPQVLTTKLAIKYGVRKSIPVSLSLCGLSCLLTPVVAYHGWWWVLVLRLLNGIGASAIIPSMINVIELWMPSQDSAKGLALLQFVQTFLYIATPLLSGYVTSIHWSWAFYMPGVVSLAFIIVWWLLIRDDPDGCPFISQKEIELIRGSSGQDKNRMKRSLNLPWYFMFRIKSFYAFMVVWMLYCSSFGGFLFLLPTYLNRILRLSAEENGFYNFIIQLGVIFSMLWPNPTALFIQNRLKVSLTVARRVVVFIYTSMSVVTWSYLAIFHDNLLIAISINRFFHMTNDTVIVATLMSQFGEQGLSGMVYSMMNTIGNLTSVLFSWASGRLLDYTAESLDCWSWIFVTMSAQSMIGLAIYVFALRSEPTPINISR